MPSPESLGEVVDITPRIKQVNAYRAGTHFLNPKGEHRARYSVVEYPTLEALDHVVYGDRPPDLEIGWVDFYCLTEVNNSPKGALLQVGETFVATNWVNPEISVSTNSYAFKTLRELTESPDLPIYTAEWLARMLKADGNTARLTMRRQPVQIFDALQHKAPLGLERITAIDRSGVGTSRRETFTQRCERLDRQALEANPDLANRVAYHG